MTSNPNDGTKFSFTVGFSFSQGLPQCEGPTMETVVSVGIGAKYRVGVSKTNEKWSTWPGLSEPQTFKNISDIFDKHGPLCGDQYIFEVFDSEDNRIFMAEFDAKSKCPADGYASDKMVCTSFSYLFELPERLQPLAKKALEAHLAKVA